MLALAFTKASRCPAERAQGPVSHYPIEQAPMQASHLLMMA